MPAADINAGQHQTAFSVAIFNVKLELLAYLPAEYSEKSGYGSKTCYTIKELKPNPTPNPLVFIS